MMGMDLQTANPTGASATTTAPSEEHRKRLVEQVIEICSLAGGLAHEIKNPLSTIRLNLDLLAEDLERSDNPRDRRALAKIRTVQQECLHLQEILDDFLRFARVDDLKLGPCLLNDVVDELVDFYHPQAVQHDIDVLTYLDRDLPALELDRHFFQQALLNLLLNAQQAMPTGGQLVLKTAHDEGSAVLEVIDNGPGMSPESVRRVFRPFYTTKREGSGLGLPTTRKIVEAHGGTIDVESEPGKGTRFVIRLPVAGNRT
jgi:signal transduction histidine kinase